MNDYKISSIFGSIIIFSLLIAFIFPLLLRAQMYVIPALDDYEFIFKDKIIIGDEGVLVDVLSFKVYGEGEYTGNVSVGASASKDAHLINMETLSPYIVWDEFAGNISNLNLGNVGIGALDPASKLHVSSTTTPQLRIQTESDTVGDKSGILLGVTASTTGNYIKGGIFYERVDAEARGKLHFALNNQAGTNNVSLADVRMTMLANGSVGIASSSPGYQLTVNGSGHFNQPVFVSTASADPHAVTLEQMYDALTELGEEIETANWLLYNDNIFNQNTGNVGIGVVNPEARLDINFLADTEGLRIISSNHSPLVIRNQYNDETLWRVDQTGSLATGSVPWLRLDAYPSDCPANQYVTGLGSTLSCAAFDTPEASKWDQTGDNIFSNNTGSVSIGTADTTYKLNVGGDVGAEAFYLTSDLSLKTNISPLVGASEKLMALRPVSFQWKKDGRASQGFIAQEIEEILPDLVGTSAITGLKAVQYNNLTAILTLGIKEQQARIVYLQAEMENLKKRINQLEK